MALISDYPAGVNVTSCICDGKVYFWSYSQIKSIIGSGMHASNEVKNDQNVNQGTKSCGSQR